MRRFRERPNETPQASAPPALDAGADDSRPRFPTSIAPDIAPAAGLLAAICYMCLASVLLLAFASSGEAALLAAMVFVVFGVMIGLVRICIGLGPKPDEPIDPHERRRRGVHTGSGHLVSRHATLQIVTAPVALTLAVTPIAVVASCVR